MTNEFKIVGEFLPMVESWLRNIVRDEMQITLESDRNKVRPKKMYTRDQVCLMAHITLPTLWQRVKDGKITPIKNGRRVLFDEAEVKRFLKEG